VVRIKTVFMTVFALVVLLSLGVVSGCGYIGRTIPPDYYAEEMKSREGSVVYETDKYGNILRKKEVIKDNK
jgi:hypothetical protein